MRWAEGGGAVVTLAVAQEQSGRERERKRARDNNVTLERYSNHPQLFSVADDKGFRKFTHAVNPMYAIPSRKTLSQKIIPGL